MSRLLSALGVLLVLFLSMGFASLNSGQRVTLRLGFATLYGIPLTVVAFGSLIAGMLVMLGASDAVFMGGSLIGEAVGGHNMLEPAALAKATITGPSYYNFSDIAEQLIKAQGLWVCQDSQQLAEQMAKLLQDQDLSQQVGQAALKVVQQNQGAVAKTVQGLAPLLTAPP